MPFKTLLWALRNVHGRKAWPKGYGLTTRRCGYCGEMVREDYTSDYGYCVGGCKPPEERTKEEPKAGVKKPVKKGRDEPVCTCGVPADALTLDEAEKIAEDINFFGSGGNVNAVMENGILIVKDGKGKGKELNRASTYTKAEAIQ